MDLNIRYPFWNHKNIHSKVRQFYIWLACYMRDHNAIREFAKLPVLGLIPVILFHLHIFDEQDLMDEINDGKERLGDMAIMNSISNTSISAPSLISLVRQKPTLSDPVEAMTKFDMELIVKPHLPPSGAMIDIVHSFKKERITLEHHAAYVYTCKDLWTADVENMDINDPFKPAALRVAKAMVLGLNIPNNIFDTSN